MARYNVNNQLGGTAQALSTSYKTIVAATAATATLTSAKVYEIGIGQDGTLNATDCQVVWDLSRQTAAGTSTAVTPVALDGSARAAGTVGSANFTAEGTITASSAVWDRSINQRGVWQWQAADEGAMFIIPATNLAGFALRAKSSNYASTAVGELKILE
jgi:hypothetical protein